MNTTSPSPLPLKAAVARLALYLGVAVGTVLCPVVHAADAFRLDRIGIVRFSDPGNNQLKLQHAVLEVDGRVTLRNSRLIDRPANTPPWAMDRDLISTDTWLGYYHLGSNALANFTLKEGAATFLIGDQAYSFVGVAPGASTATGQLINLSTRARLAGGSDVIISGFVVDQRDQLVLVRVVGPTLAQYGVPDAAPDPTLSLMRGTQKIHVNDNWNTHAASGAVRLASSRVGAFPLTEGSKDAARLIRLQPGVYSVIVEASPHNPAGGTVLLEVYGVPDADDYELVTTGES